jgi:hypothetical protein
MLTCFLIGFAVDRARLRMASCIRLFLPPKIVCVMDLGVAHWHLIKVGDGSRVKGLVLHYPIFTPEAGMRSLRFAGSTTPTAPSSSRGGRASTPKQTRL